ncbi:MAG: hypothetical protein ACLUFV_12985 [Acutalibacteraceae bacterium]
MTSLTVEIRGVPRQHRAAARFLAQAGLKPAAPAPSAPDRLLQGTTCQFGLIDTFALSEKSTSGSTAATARSSSRTSSKSPSAAVRTTASSPI